MADTRDIDLEAILKRLEFLEKENDSLRAEVEELKTNDIEIKAELNTINRFISAMTESQSIDEIMTEIESAAKQLTMRIRELSRITNLSLKMPTDILSFLTPIRLLPITNFFRTDYSIN